MSYFHELGLAEPILRALDSKGYDTPTPIQKDAIPALMQGRDLLGIAQTGTGKTAAFSLPSLHHLAKETRGRTHKGCRMLVLSPTRELAAQIAENIREYARYLNLSVNCVFGGMPIFQQKKKLAPGTDVLVATPGRLLDLIEQRALTLENVEIFVLDEADQMMDLGFIVPLKRIASMLPKNRQSLFFSATMPKAIAELGARFLNNPVRVEVAPQATTAERVEQYVTFVSQSEKQALLTLKIQEIRPERTLVFTRTKHGADKVVRALAGAGIRSAAIHGNKSQSQRTAALKAFKDDEIKVLIATDIAARGIDITGVSHVFNYDLPHVPEQYVHRIGRTARNGADGIAIAFVSGDERGLLKDIERLTKVKPETMPLPKGFSEAAALLPPPAKAPANSSDRPGQGRGGERGAPGGRNYGPRRDGEGGNRRRGSGGGGRPGGGSGGGRSGSGGGGGARVAGVGAHKGTVKRIG